MPVEEQWAALRVAQARRVGHRQTGLVGERVGDDHAMGEVARLDARAAQLDEVLQRLGEQFGRGALGLGPALVVAEQLDDDGVAQRPLERRGQATDAGHRGVAEGLGGTQCGRRDGEERVGERLHASAGRVR